MPPRTSATERHRRLGYEVRRLRTSADMNTEVAAGLLGLDRAKLSNIETGVRTVSPERLRTLACNCHCSDARYLDSLIELARPKRKGWWERYRGKLSAGLLDIADLESRAHRVRSIHMVHIPGLLQTSDHTLAILRKAVPRLDDQESALRLAFRMERKKILTSPNAPEYVAVVHEAALRMRFGGVATAREQTEYLLEASLRPNVQVRIVPFGSEGFTGSGQIVNYFEGPVRQLDTVEIDSSHGPEFLYAEAQLTRYREQLDIMEEAALSQESSRGLMQRLIKEYSCP